MTEKTKSEAIAADIAALLRARNPLLWIVTREEGRAERYLFEAAASAGMLARTWDCAQGACEMDGAPSREVRDATDVGVMLQTIGERARGSGDRCAWIMRDMAPWLSGPIGIMSCRQLRNLARLLPTIPTDRAQAIMVITPSADVPAELAGHATVIDWPMPDRAEIAAMVDELARTYKLELNGRREAAIDAAIGLTGEEAQACYSKSIVQTRAIDPVAVAKEKRRVIARERVLEWFDPLPGGLAAVGGLDGLKAWLMSRAAAFTKEARAYGLPAPKGVLLVGVSGCGKSLIAKAIATAYGVPLLKVDLGALKSKFVGESEGNLRKAFAVIETVGRCVVWFDEIEKALQGATSGSADGGVSSDALGAILGWMQERRGEAFVIATANDVEGLPPELLRKGRFDEIFFVDTPNATERVAVLEAALTAHGRNIAIRESAADQLVPATEGFTGAEIAACVPDALFAAFADNGREINTADLLAAAKTVVPLTKTASEKIDRLRTWARGRARPATLAGGVTEATRAPTARVLDIA